MTIKSNFFTFKNISNHQKTLFFLMVLLFSNILCSAQDNKKIELLNAESLSFDKSISADYRTLVGSVAFRQGNMFMYCDSAHFYSDANKVDAYSNIHIVEGDTLNLYGNTLFYDGDARVANVRGNVVMRDKQMTLTTQALDYDFKTETAFYLDNGKIVDKENTLTSKAGYYYANKKMFAFHKNVKLVNPKYVMKSDTLKYNTVKDISYFFGPTTIVGDSNYIYCENGWYDSKKDVSQYNRNAIFTHKRQSLKGDSLYYNRNTGLGKSIGNVEIYDTAQKIIITGKYAESWEKDDKALVTGNALLRQLYAKDTLYLHADTLRALPDSSKQHKILKAYYHTKFYKSDIQGMCDSLSYSFADSLIRLYRSPILWSDSNQLTGDYVEIQTGNQKIVSLFLDGNAFMTSERDTGQYNQIKGKVIRGYFKDNDLVRIDAEGSGQTVYYAEEDNGSLLGINRAESVKLSIFLDDNKIKSISFIQSPDATLWPEEQISKEDLFLKGFVWHKNKRPLKPEDIFIWQ